MVDLFAGPGGLDVAAKWLGLSAVGIEWDANACATRGEARLDTESGDVASCDPSGQRFEAATILTGGPPCQTFTVAGGGEGRRSIEEVIDLVKEMASGRVKEEQVVEKMDALDQRTRLVLQPLRWALEAMESHAAGERSRPFETIVLEQVPTVLPVWKRVGEALRAIGYKTSEGILCAEEFGVPQTRKRAILIASLKNQPELPSSTHEKFLLRGRMDAANSRRQPCVSMAEALSGADALKWSLPFTVVSNYGTGGNPKDRGRRQHYQPAATITGKVRRNRIEFPGVEGFKRFELAEAGILQTFPFDYPWQGRDVAQQIGNAIPPRLGVHVLAEALGWSVDVAWLDEVVKSSWQKQDWPLFESWPGNFRSPMSGALS